MRHLQYKATITKNNGFTLEYFALHSRITELLPEIDKLSIK